MIHNRFAYYYFLVGKCKPQCVALGLCSQPCDRVFQLSCPLHRASPAHCHLCLQIGQRCLTSRMLPVSRRLWRPNVSGTSLPHHPPSDLTISTSPGSYPCQYGSIPYWRGHQSPQMSRNLPQDKPLMLLSPTLVVKWAFCNQFPSHFCNPCNIFCLILLTFWFRTVIHSRVGLRKTCLLCGCQFCFTKSYALSSEVITTIQLFLAQKDVPGVGTKLSINFEPFLVLDQWTTLCTCHAAIIRRDEFQEIQLIHVSCLCDPNAESHKMTFGNFSFLLFRWHFYEIIILVYKFRRKNMNHNSSHFL